MKNGNATQNGQLYRRGLGLKKEVAGQLESDYSSAIIDYFKSNNYEMPLGGSTLYLAKEFGFCYGVDRAVDYAYQSRTKFPDRRVFLTGEIIHNPHVNRKMLAMDIQFLSGQYADGNSFDSLDEDDVVILPAFGVTIQELEILKGKGCILVDTTCGSVLNVWKRVEQYARDGFTSVIHGKYYHEETKATSSQTQKYPNAHYLVVLDMEETERVCDYIAGKMTKDQFFQLFKNAVSEGFDPDIHLEKIGVANQTTMLSSESLAVGERLRKEMTAKFGDEETAQRFRTFDTICSATQERQDAILELLQNKNLDLMLVIGGYNSSNTGHLAELSGEYTKAFHIEDARCLVDRSTIRHLPAFQKEERIAKDWLPAGNLRIGLTAGASTPNNKIGEVVMRLAELGGHDLETLLTKMSV